MINCENEVAVKCSQPMITSEIRFLTIDMVKGDVKIIVSKNVKVLENQGYWGKAKPRGSLSGAY